MFFCAVKVLEIAEHDGVYTLRGAAWGEPVDFQKHHVRAEVKAATYGGLRYRMDNGTHRFKLRHDLRYTGVHLSQPCLLTQSPCVAVAARTFERPSRHRAPCLAYNH
jgi:Archease protein family (MTH1598/TM1083)